jgi:phospholipid/cholesterol/gamma-HCH transport system permease protein
MQRDTMTDQFTPAQFHLRRTDETAAEIRFEGDWRVQADIPLFQSLVDVLEVFKPAGIGFDTRTLKSWDSAYLAFLLNLRQHCRAENIAFDAEGLPEGARRMLELALAVPERTMARGHRGDAGWLAQVGGKTLAVLAEARALLLFTGEAVVAAVRLAAGRARFPWRGFGVMVQDCGVRALPIVSLISILVGLILAFVGAVQLRMFGAQIYVANLVGLGMAREMGAMMAAVIMAGRTGAAFAAQLGTMQVNEEIDALVTMGISPIEFLVLPRMLALVLMMPLLCIYADLMGIAGGFIVGTGMLSLPFKQYWVQTQHAVALNHFAVGLVKSAVFGVLVAMAGCLRGMQCGRSAMAVGEAATRAVVTGIVAIVVADALITVICNVIGV